MEHNFFKRDGKVPQNMTPTTTYFSIEFGKVYSTVEFKQKTVNQLSSSNFQCRQLIAILFKREVELLDEHLKTLLWNAE